MTQIVTNPTVRRLVSQLGLPIKLPTVIQRDPPADTTKALLGRRVALIGLDRDGKHLEAAGAQMVGPNDDADAIIIHVTQPKSLYGTLKGIKLKPHAHLLLVTTDDASEADKDAVVGFAKSYAKEVGAKAITVNVIDMGPKTRAATTLAWFASNRSRYVTAQRVSLVGGENGTLSLAGEHALVTGAARGIGAAIAETLARQGAEVTLVDLPQAKDSALEVIARIHGRGGRAKFVGADVTRDSIAEKSTILVNNAGITRDKTFAKMSEEQWNQVIAVNYEAAVKTTEEWIAAGNTGPVIFMSSVVGISGNFGQTNYTLSKAAIMGYVRSLKGVRANAIAPGFIDTVLTREVPFLNREVSKQLTCLLQAGEPSDIAEVVAFLASPASSAISGQTIRVDGGMFFGA